MGKGTDKLYITHSEWNSSDQFSASAGAGVRQKTDGAHASFKRLPLGYCSLSLQPASDDVVCTLSGQLFDHENIVRWLLKHDTNPVDGTALKQSDLIKLNIQRNDDGRWIDPVTFKVLTDNTHVVAVNHGGSANVFSYDTVERLNIKPKMWQDLLTDELFSRRDIITLQDPQNLESRDLSSFKYIQSNQDTGIPKQEASINTSAIGSSAAKILKAKEAVAKARAERAAVPTQNGTTTKQPSAPKLAVSKNTPHNASHHTTGLAAASLTSTGMTPHTSAALATLSDEDYLLKRGRVKQNGYVRLSTTLGDLTLELYPTHAPKTVWNFITLTQKGYYNNVIFHRNIRNFMLQTGDPTGTGRGGTSVWGKNFEDEFEGPLKHDGRGWVSMANKGKNTNSSQFFITYRPASHLDRKHTIFGKVVEGWDVLQALEEVAVDANDKPLETIKIVEAVVFVDPFAEYLAQERETEKADKTEKKEEDRTTWTGKRIRRDGTVEDAGGGGVGKYLNAVRPVVAIDDRETMEDDEPVRKKVKGSGGFGDFSGW